MVVKGQLHSDCNPPQTVAQLQKHHIVLHKRSKVHQVVLSHKAREQKRPACASAVPTLVCRNLSIREHKQKKEGPKGDSNFTAFDPPAMG